MSFAHMNLNPNVSKGIAACGYTAATPVQVRSIPDIINKKDLVVVAPTGTGKTAAFVLPCLHHISNQKSMGKPRVLVLTPTRELATQITNATSKYGKFMRFNMASLVGGMSYRQQLRDLSRPVDIIVATPGRLLDHMSNRRLDLSGIEILILDEADRMLDMGFIDDVTEIAKATPNTRQTLLFSATMDNGLNRVISKLLKNPIHIDLSNEKLTPSQIKQELYMADSSQHKTKILRHLLENNNIFKAIIFSATKINADRLAEQLRTQGYRASPLHGDLKQNVRNRTIDELRRGKIQFVVATDVAARGIDISDLSHVFNYDLPKFPEDYVHRIGRTGRAGADGIAISLALPMDRKHLQRIEKYIEQRIQTLTIPGLEPSNKQTFHDAAPKQHKRRFGGGDRAKWNKSRPTNAWRKKDDKKERNKSFDSYSGEKRKHSRNQGDSFHTRSENPTKKRRYNENPRESFHARSERPNKKWGRNKSQSTNRRFSDS